MSSHLYKRTGPPWPALIQIAADGIEKLRKQDLYRVLDWHREICQELAYWITTQRPQFADEVRECLADIDKEITEASATLGA